VLPTSKSRPKPRTASGSAAQPVVLGGGPAAAGGHAPLRPIGPERLRALREAIRDGTYPTEDDVVSGLERMLRSAPE
jgi:hypothetical protein